MTIFSKVLLASILAMALGLWLSWATVDRTPPPTDLPWQIEATADGSIKVFQTHLGTTTLGEFILHYRVHPEITLFVSPQGERVIEAYFDSLILAGLKAKVVLLLNVDSSQLDAMYDRGLRISTMGSGTRKVELSSEDVQTLNNAVIAGITYIPTINVSTEWLQKRFGEPTHKIKDNNTGAVHWVYADKGLDIALNDNDKEVFQYVHPKDIARLVEPLMPSAPTSNP